jgi:hypothetical protein
MRHYFSGILLGMALGIFLANLLINKFAWSPGDARLSFVNGVLVFISVVVEGLHLKRKRASGLSNAPP